MSRFLCLRQSTREVLYEADGLPQIQGYIDAAEVACRVVVELESRTQQEYLFQVAVVDRMSGQVVARGPIVDLFGAGDALAGLTLTVLPLDIADREYQLREQTLDSLRGPCDCGGGPDCDCDDDDGEEWKNGGAQ